MKNYILELKYILTGYIASIFLMLIMLILFFSPINVYAQNIEKYESITMSQGNIKIIPFSEKITRIALGNGKTVSATTIDSNLLLIAEEIGKTQLIVWTGKKSKAFDLKVVHPNLESAKRLLADIVNKNAGLEMKEVNSKIVITGVAHAPVIAQMEKISSEIPDILLNMRQDEGIEAAKSVYFKLHFIEVKKSLLENIGIKWNKSMTGPVYAGQAANASGVFNIQKPANAGALPFITAASNSHSGSFFGIGTMLASNINLGVSNGDIRVLASPELTAKSGGKATLQVGGEVPIPQAGAFGATSVEFKPYGVIFDIDTRVDTNGVITAKLSTELSQIDPAVSVGGIPGFLTRSTSTELSLRSGDIFALSGLLNGELSNSIDKIPGLGNIPILGRLFSSDDYRNSQSDLVVLVETEIIDNETGSAAALRARGLQNISDYQDIKQNHQEHDEKLSGRKPLEKYENKSQFDFNSNYYGD